MIHIFCRISKELASWMAIWRFLRSLDRDALFYQDIDGPADSSKNAQIKRWEFKPTRRGPRVMRGGLSKQSTLEFR